MDLVVSLSHIEHLGHEAHWVPFSIVTQLGQYHSGGIAQGIDLHSKWHLLVQLDQDWSGCYKGLEFFEGLLLFLCPSPLFSFLGELVEWFGSIQEISDETSVEVNEPYK